MYNWWWVAGAGHQIISIEIIKVYYVKTFVITIHNDAD
jgi:hypothetical protein